MPIIRDEIRAFVEQWNYHYVRPHYDVPGHIHGQPDALYRAIPPNGAPHFGILVSPEDLEYVESQIGDCGKLYSVLFVTNSRSFIF
jgi:hypothetical protein